MMTEQTTKITEWVKANSSVSKVAVDLGKSRPTVYKWMELYDNGNKDQIPEEAVAYFDKNLAEKESLSVLRIKSKLTEEMVILSDRIEDFRERINPLVKQKSILSKDIANTNEELSAASDEQEQKRLKMKLISLMNEEQLLTRECDYCGANITALMEKYNETGDKLGRYDNSVTSLTKKSKEIYPIKTTCTIEGNRCMIIHNGNASLDYKFILQIFGKVGDEYIFLKEFISDENPYYEHEWDENPIGSISTNYFIIDGFLFSGPLYYKIIGYDQNNCCIDEENTSGMCELKQRQ